MFLFSLIALITFTCLPSCLTCKFTLCLFSLCVWVICLCHFLIKSCYSSIFDVLAGNVIKLSLASDTSDSNHSMNWEQSPIGGEPQRLWVIDAQGREVWCTDNNRKEEWNLYNRGIHMLVILGVEVGWWWTEMWTTNRMVLSVTTRGNHLEH